MKLVSSWVMDTLKERGAPCPDRDRLRKALADLSEEEGARISEALGRLRKGGEANGDIDLAYAIGKSLKSSTVEVVERVVGGVRESQLLRWALETPGWDGMVMRASAGGEKDVAALMSGLCVGDRVSLVSDESGADDGSYEQVANSEEVAMKGQGKFLGGFEDEDSGKSWEQRPGQRADVHRVFARSGKLAFEMDVASGSVGTRRRVTIRIEATERPVAREGASEGQIADLEREAWRDKIIFQLTVRELHQAAATLLGAQKSCTFRSHGKDNDKRCEIRSQDGGVMVAVSQGSRTIGVPIDHENLYPVSVMVCRALFMNDSDIDQSVLLNILRLCTKQTGNGKSG